MHVYCNFSMLTSKENLFGPPLFWAGYATVAKDRGCVHRPTGGLGAVYPMLKRMFMNEELSTLNCMLSSFNL